MEVDSLTVRNLVDACRAGVRNAGWWDCETDAFVAKAMLVVTEVAEAVKLYCEDPEDMEVWYEETRGGRKPCGIPSKLANAVIRICDLAGRYEIALDRAIVENLAYNEPQKCVAVDPTHE